MPDAAVWVVAAVAVYAVGVAIYAIFYWPWSRAQRALRRLRTQGRPSAACRRARRASCG